MTGALPTEWTVTARRLRPRATTTPAATASVLGCCGMIPPRVRGREGGTRDKQVACRSTGAIGPGPARRELQRRRSGRCARIGPERIADAVPLHAAPQRNPRDPEGGRGALAVPAMVVQHAEDARALVRPEAAGQSRRGTEHGGEIPP